MLASVVSGLGQGCRAGVIFCVSVRGLMRQGRPVKVRCAHACRAIRCNGFAACRSYRHEAGIRVFHNYPDPRVFLVSDQAFVHVNSSSAASGLPFFRSVRKQFGTTLPTIRVSDMQHARSTGCTAVPDTAGRGCSVTSRNGGTARFVVMLLMLLSTPVGASSVVPPDDSCPGPALDVMTAGDAGQTRPQSVEVQQTAGWLPPADASGAAVAGVMHAIPLAEAQTKPSSRPDDSPKDRLMLFFLLLMAAVFGLLIEITTARQRR